jgi:AraC-like DNA-binding protein
MELEDRYRQFIAAHTIPPPRTSGAPLHWDGVGAASRHLALPPRTALPTCAAVLALEQRLTGRSMPLAVPPPLQAHDTGPAAPASHWATEAARLIVYMAVELLQVPCAPGLPAVTGTLKWICQTTPGVGGTPTGHPALFVQTVCGPCQGVYRELVPHVPADDPLSHHMALVLQTAYDAADVAGRLYATALAEALAVHVLRRYRVYEEPAHAGPGGLSPAQRQRTLTYIQAHLAEALSLPTLAAVAHTSPAYFARLFKQAMGQTPHQYVIQCRIAAAQRLLAETDLALSAIGLQVGYADQSHFTALFHRHVATTPRAYRAATQQV